MMKGRINLDYEHSPDQCNCHRALYLYLQKIERTKIVVPIRAVLIVQKLPELHNLTNSLSYIHLFRELA